MTESPVTARVSVVIPTRGRPELLDRALRSVLAQTLPDWEAIVVVDGPDAPTEAMLHEQSDARIRFLVTDEQRGGGAARNAGIAEARAEWIALLDDDDEWLPERLERQLADLESGRPDPWPEGVEPIGICRRIVRTPAGDVDTWPRRPPGPSEPLGDYLWLRRSLRGGQGGIQSSAIVARRRLFLDVPFDPALPRYQDADWALRAHAAGARLRYLDAVLTIWHTDEARWSITGTHAASWRYAYDWIRARRHLVTPRAYAAFLLTRGGDLAGAAGSARGAFTMASEAFRHGRPTIPGVLLFAGKWAFPRSLRRRVRLLLSRRRPVPGDAAPRGT